MSNQFKHTPEPWVLYDDGELGSDIILANVDGENYDLARIPTEGDEGRPPTERKANAKRIVACVNGCAGIVDPETTVPELVAALRAAVAFPVTGSWCEKANAVLDKVKGGN